MARMRAVTFDAFGPPDVLRATEVEPPEPGPDDELVRIHAAGICHHDVLSRAGKIPGRPGRILGHETDGVIAATSSPEKAASVHEAGADDVIVAPDLKFGAQVWRLTAKEGADVVLENVVTGTFHESLRSSAPNATVVVLGNLGAKPVELDPGLMIMRRIRIAGSGNATFADVHTALQLLATGAVKPCTGRILRLPPAALGHALMEEPA